MSRRVPLALEHDDAQHLRALAERDLATNGDERSMRIVRAVTDAMRAQAPDRPRTERVEVIKETA